MRIVTCITYYTLLLLIFAMCACKKEDADQLSVKNEVVLAAAGDMVTINPILETDNDSYTIHIEVWQGLNALHPETLRLIPVLASLPVVSDDKLSYSYIIDSRARWSDDSPVTAADVIFTFKSIMNQTAQASASRSNFMELDSVWSPKNGMVTFHFSKVNFKHDYDIAGVSILPKHRLDTNSLTDEITWSDLHSLKPNAKVRQAGEEFASTEKSTDIHRFIGSGPYMFEDWKRGERIVLKKNDRYWAQNIPWLEAYPDRLIYRVFSNNNSSIVALKAKELDVAGINSNQYLQGFDSVRYKFIKKGMVYDGSYHYLAWNNDKPIFASKKVRNALTMLVNRDAMIHLILHDLARKLESPLTPSVPGWDSTIKQPDYNPAEARKLLAEDGWTDSDGDGILDKMIDGVRVPFKFNIMTESKDPQLLIVCEDMRKVGIEANLSILEFSVGLQNLRERVYDAYLGSFSWDPTERDFYEEFYSAEAHSGGGNVSCYANPEVDKLIDSLQKELDRNQRMLISKQIQSIVVADAPITYLYSKPEKFAWIDRFDNVQFLPFAPYIDPRYLIVRGSGVKKIDYSAKY